jgi:glycerol-1-phosphate dehydrogenase [NAD(P)+]
MDDLSVNGNPVTHGHKVAMGSLICSAFLEVFFADPDGPPPRPATFVRPTLDERIAETRSAFAGSPALESVLKIVVDKFPDGKTTANICDGFRDTWKETREKVMEQIMPYSEFREMLVKARCPVQPTEINLNRSALIACARRAQMIRKRYNELDLAWDIGCLETVLAKLEESGKYFC